MGLPSFGMQRSNRFPIFRENVVVSCPTVEMSWFFLYITALEGCTNRSSRNVDNQLPSDAATSHPRRTETATIPLRKPKSSQGKTLTEIIHLSLFGSRRRMGSRFITPFILNLGLDGGEWLASRSVHLTPRQTALGNRRMGAGWEPEPVFTLRGKEISLAPNGNRTTIPRLCNVLTSLHTD